MRERRTRVCRSVVTAWQHDPVTETVTSCQTRGTRAPSPFKSSRLYNGAGTVTTSCLARALLCCRPATTIRTQLPLASLDGRRAAPAATARREGVQVPSYPQFARRAGCVTHVVATTASKPAHSNPPTGLMHGVWHWSGTRRWYEAWRRPFGASERDSCG